MDLLKYDRFGRPAKNRQAKQQVLSGFGSQVVFAAQSRVIAMGMRNDSSRYTLPRIDVEIARRAIKALSSQGN
jgi:hypothetical protein